MEDISMFKKLFSLLGQALKGTTVYGVNRTKMNNPIGSNIVDPGQDGGRLQVQFDTYELDGLSIDDTIQLGNALAKGARVHAIHVSWDALGESTTIDIGDGDDDDRYDTGIDTSSAGQAWCDNIAGKNYEVGTADDDDQIQATLEGGEGTGTLNVLILYSHA